MTDADPDRTRTALYTWEQLVAAKPDEATVTIGKVEVQQPPAPETFTGDEYITAGIPDVVGIDEVCEILGLSFDEVEALRSGDAADPNFPAATELQCGPVWDARWVRHYAAQKR